MTVHAYVGGSGIKTVNAAYSSQTCPDPTCGYVHSGNRHGDVFHCRNPYWDCNWQGDVDHVAAMNLLNRIEDHQINRFTPYREVKKILDERFLRRLESRVGARIVPLGTTGNGVRGTCVEDGATAHGRTPSILRQPKLDVGGGQPPTRPSSVPVDRAEHAKAAGERRQKRCI
ncbi:zinc ribbon domain-containing protein [Ferrimicrobium acidiphilum]|uniref:zinc ribbon domain-containing protein n=1 Tax=Ferrimicrobium acidiphilum TaxID=121039 RepID=UPI003D18C852